MKTAFVFIECPECGRRVKRSLRGRIYAHTRRWLPTYSSKCTVSGLNLQATALKLLKYIEHLGQNGVDIRMSESGEWVISDHWNQKIQGYGNRLVAAIEKLPQHRGKS